jgi:hypothetical protein
MMNMLKPTLLVLVALLPGTRLALAEVFYVDPVQGQDFNKGTSDQPLATLSKAISLANSLKGEGPITIKLFPGLYVLTDKLMINPARTAKNDARFTVEAAVMPDDEHWAPDKMPVIQSISANNSETQFIHATGFLAATNYISLRGLKFLGNPNPSVIYYYPVSKEDESLLGMEVSQCLFVSDENLAPIQGGIWAHGPDTDINHCVFYNCRNAVLLFKSVDGFSITNTLFYGATESAIWMGPIESDFVFKNNVVSNCHYCWVRPENTKPAYQLSDCHISENDFYMGFYTDQGLVETSAESDRDFKETNVARSGNVKLVEKREKEFPREHLHLTPDSKGHELGAGIFRRKPAS